MLKNRKKHGALGVVVMAILGVLMMNVTMAGAIGEAGTGTSTGEFTVLQTDPEDPPLPQIPDDLPLCLKVRNATLELHNVGSFTATEVGPVPPTATFVGHTKATIVAQADYWFSPAGTFSNDICTVPALVPVTINVTTVSATRGVSATCSGKGVYSRTGENAEVTSAVKNTTSSPTTASANTALPDRGSCTVTEVATTLVRTDNNVVLTFTGLQQPCLPAPLPDVCTSVSGPPPVYTEWVGTYTET